MKKENVYVEVRTEKQAKKLKKVLDMFGEKIYSSKSVDEALEMGWVIEFDEDQGLWCNSWGDVKTKISIKQLRNILAIEHLEKGDVVVVKGSDTGIKRVGVVNSFESFRINEISIYSDNFTDLDQKEPEDGLFGFSGNFIRYATEEEKELLKPDELTADDYNDLTWYRLLQTGKSFFLDKSKDKNYGFNPKFCDKLEWFIHFKENGFHVKENWIEMSDEEVKNLLEKECIRRYGANWEEVELVNHADGDYLGNINKGMFVNNIAPERVWNINGIIFYKGKWADALPKEQTSEQKVIDYAKSVDWDFDKVFNFIGGIRYSEYLNLDGHWTHGKTQNILDKHKPRDNKSFTYSDVETIDRLHAQLRVYNFRYDSNLLTKARELSEKIKNNLELQSE